MQKNIEVEVRGRLSDEKYEKLLAFMKENAEFLETKKRLLLDYSTFLPGEGVKERTRDIRLRITNGQPEIITKIGSWGGKESRKELSINTEKGSFDTLVQNYAVLGYKKAILAVRNTEVFQYKNIEFALVEVPGHSYYFEAERMAVSGEEEKIHEELRNVCEEIDLVLFDNEGFYAYIEELNREANEVFEYKNHTEGYFDKYIGNHAEIEKQKLNRK